MPDYRNIYIYIYIETKCSYPTPHQPTTQPSTCPPACLPACLPAGGGVVFLLCKSQKRGSITQIGGRVSVCIFTDRNEHHESMVKRISKHIKSSNTSLSLERALGLPRTKSCLAYSCTFSACQRKCEKGRPPFCCIYAMVAACFLPQRAATNAYITENQHTQTPFK